MAGRRATACHAMGLAALATLLAAALPVTTLSAQEHPDLSGPWSVAGGGGGRGRGGGAEPDPGSGWGRAFFIVQSGDRLRVERPFFSPGDLQPDPVLHFALDGSEAVDTLLMGRGVQELRSTAHWEGDRLVIVTTLTAPGGLPGRTVTSEVRRTLWLEPSRQLTNPPSLVIETTRVGVMGGETFTTRTVYTRG